MTKKILISLTVIGVVAAIAIGGTIAYFSDTETVPNNTFSTGIIDIELEPGDSYVFPFTIKDMKPCETGYITFEIHNPGNNPVNVWKHIKNVVTEDGIITEPECEYGGGIWDPNSKACDVEGEGGSWEYEPWHRIDKWILYDLSVKVPFHGGDPVNSGWWQIIYDENVTVADITSKMVFLGMIPPHEIMEVTQSYHLKPETENWAQADTMTFDIEIYAEQLRGKLTLENKSGAPDWQLLLGDGIKGILTYDLTSPTFDYTFSATGLQDDADYCLIYYADPWPGTNGKEIACGLTSGTDLDLSGSVDLGMDIPVSGDNNYPEGGKIWLVLDNDYDDANHKMTGWNPDKYLFETALITYDDTDI